MPRFFVNPTDISGDRVVLTGDNAHHAAYSLRLAPGHRISVCNRQSQTAYLCELTAFDSETVTARILAEMPDRSEPPYMAHLFQALPKGDKLDTVIQKAVECGVASITPFESSRCIMRAKPDTEARKTERRARIIEEAAKQCGRCAIPDIAPTTAFSAMLDAAAPADLVLFCYEGEGTRPLPAVLREAKMAFPTERAPEVAVIVGSEGGFSPEEAAAARDRGFAMVGLGRRILRTETASGFVLSCLSYELEL